MNDKLKAFERILHIMNDLREKCPWDKKQTMETLRPLTIEEVYELNEAIASGNIKDIKEELGDILLHIVFYAKIGEEQQHFDIAEVINALCEKLIARHPHIYGDVQVANEEDVKANWEKLKLKEGKTSVLQGVPKSLPALPKAQRIQDKVRQIGFDWEHRHQVWAKVQEEIGELKEVVDNNQQDEMEKEFGDVLFALVNYARFIGVNPEAALEKTNTKFIKRFQYMEQKALTNKVQLSDMTLAEMDVWWEEAKTHE